MNSINAFLVRSENGSVDLDATTAKFRGALEVYLAERETELSQIAEAVHGVFDQYKGVSLNMPALLNFALGRLNPTPATHALLSERTVEYVRDNAGEGKIFTIAKGKGGGVRRNADHTPKA